MAVVGDQPIPRDLERFAKRRSGIRSTDFRISSTCDRENGLAHPVELFGQLDERLVAVARGPARGSRRPWP